MTAAAPEQTVRPAEDAVESPHEEVVAPDDDLVLADVLVEEISIDGMCGVY